ncbi:MAG: hypothetical protein JSU00_01335 [Acidobacteria bacterium]|nr:hypothetical protein [Acidobacteriota bacterium]
MSSADWQLTGLAVFAALMFALAVWVLFLRKESPERREKRRRNHVNLHGRLADGILTDVDADTLYYTYSVAGVDYQTSQDVQALAAGLPAERERLIGPVTLKYLPRYPANSIVVCESWSGLRIIINKETVFK